MYAVPPEHPSRPALRDQTIEAWLPLSRRLASRYQGRGEPADDLVQTAVVGLIKAIDHYDPRHGNGFVCYAVPTITGEIKRHFRDQAWMIRVPRRLQELRIAISSATNELTHTLSRPPTVADLAVYLDITEEQVRQGIEGSHAYSAESTHPRGDGQNLYDVIGVEEHEYGLIELRVALEPALARLSERDRTIVILRFYGNLTQAQIASHLGISQMHVSRLIVRSLLKLRRSIEGVTV